VIIFLEELFDESLKLLRIKMSSSMGLYIAPSYLIEKLWHARIFSTWEYHAMCQRHNNINNVVYRHQGPVTRRGQERYERALFVYRTNLREPLNAEILPADVDDQGDGEEEEVDVIEDEGGEYSYIIDFGDGKRCTEAERIEWHQRWGYGGEYRWNRKGYS
jgi:hypothetical protein